VERLKQAMLDDQLFDSDDLRDDDDDDSDDDDDEEANADGEPDVEVQPGINFTKLYFGRKFSVKFSSSNVGQISTQNQHL
jgi:hypothetical protein